MIHFSTIDNMHTINILFKKLRGDICLTEMPCFKLGHNIMWIIFGHKFDLRQPKRECGYFIYSFDS